MIAAFRESYVEYVIFMGVTERYPSWFEDELYHNVHIDEDRYTFWMPPEEREVDYYDKTLVEDYSVFLRKPSGEIFVTNYDVFNELYISFKYVKYTNSGIAAFEQDCIEYVECQPGMLPAGYPDWFYEFYSETINFPYEEDAVFMHDDNFKVLTNKAKFFLNDIDGHINCTKHSVFLKNRVGEVRGMSYSDFIKYYEPNPEEDMLWRLTSNKFSGR